MNHNAAALSPERITRFSYFTRWVGLGFVAVIASCMMEAFEHVSGVAAVVLMGGAASLILFSLVALFRSILIPRVRDVGLHPAWSLLIFLHSIGSLFVLALLFIPTNAFAKPSHFRYPSV